MSSWKKTKKRPYTKVAAVVTIRKAADMTPEGRKDIAAWLRRQAHYLVKHGKDYDTEFRGRYHYTTGR